MNLEFSLSTIVVTSELIDTEKQNKSLTNLLLIQWISNQILIIIDAYNTIHEIWDRTMQDYTYKDIFSQAHLRYNFIASYFPNKIFFLSELCLN